MSGGKDYMPSSAQRVQSTHMGNTYPNHKEITITETILCTIGTLDPLGWGELGGGRYIICAGSITLDKVCAHLHKSRPIRLGEAASCGFSAARREITPNLQDFWV